MTELIADTRLTRRFDRRGHHDVALGLPVTRDVTGNQLMRVPRLSLRVTPSLNLFAGRLRVDAEFVRYFGRFADIANTQRLPPYALIKLDVNAKSADRLAIALHVANLANTLGLTEGNPRAGSFDAGGMDASYFLARPGFGRTIRATVSLSY